MSSATGPRSLVDTCLKVAVDNIRLIQDVSGLPQRYLGPILSAVKTSAQLHVIEVNSGDIYDETAKHWRRLIARDFHTLSARHNYAPNNRKSWHKVYEQYKTLQEEQIAAATENLKQAFAARDQEKHSRTSTIISCEKSNALRPAKARSGWGPPREKQTFLQKARAQVRLEATRFNLRTPTGKLLVPQGQIKKAPQSIIEGARIASQPSVLQPRSIRPARIRCAPNQELEAREARLRQAKKKTAPKTGNLLAFSDDEDETSTDGRSAVDGDKQDGDADDLFGSTEVDEDDLFGDLVAEKTVTTVPSPSKAPTQAPPATPQPAKRRRSNDETGEEQAAKRRRCAEQTAPSPSAPDQGAAKVPSPAAARPPMPARRPIRLSAAPGATSVLRPFPRRAPSKTPAKPSAPPKPSGTPTAPGQLPRNRVSEPPRTARPSLETPREAAQRRIPRKDATGPRK